MTKTTKARLVLQDGVVFEGIGFGATKESHGEVVFNTSLTGYQEILTDPSYAGQLVCLTYPQIGIYGINPEDHESRRVFASGLIVRDATSVFSNYRSDQSVHEFLKDQGVAGIAGIDTRALVRHIRDQGAMPALLSFDSAIKTASLKSQAKKLQEMTGQNLAEGVSCEKSYVFKEERGSFIKNKKPARAKKARYRVVAYDFGVKKNILRLLKDVGCQVQVVPYDYPAQKILDAANVDGVFLSNGPGDPAACAHAIEQVKQLVGKKPLFGICLGHQILSLALGAKTFKLKFGHHGGNQPVKNLLSNHVEITAQNHGFAIDEKSLPKAIEITHRHLNDQTISGIRHRQLKAFSVQYHPESAPGPNDSRYLFEDFIKLMEAN